MRAAPRSSGSVVLDASAMMALSSAEAGRDALVTAELARYANLGYGLYAPGVLIAETVFVLCGKLKSRSLSPADYQNAVAVFQRTMSSVSAPPGDDSALITRAEQTSSGYGCSRSADGIYIALAEELQLSGPVTILTFDRNMPAHPAAKAPTTTVRLL